MLFLSNFTYCSSSVFLVWVLFHSYFSLWLWVSYWYTTCTVYNNTQLNFVLLIWIIFVFIREFHESKYNIIITRGPGCVLWSCVRPFRSHFIICLNNFIRLLSSNLVYYCRPIWYIRCSCNCLFSFHGVISKNWKQISVEEVLFAKETFYPGLPLVETMLLTPVIDCPFEVQFQPPTASVWTPNSSNALIFFTYPLNCAVGFNCSVNLQFLVVVLIENCFFVSMKFTKSVYR